MSVIAANSPVAPHQNNIATHISEEKNAFRNYVDSHFQDRVSKFYYENHANQNVEFVKKKHEQLLKLDRLKMSMHDAVLLLNEVVDDSDPDTDFPQIVHLLQTAEAIRQQYPGEEFDWFHLVGFIHDLGKILAHPKVFNEPQWAVVGDTFPVGCAFSESVIFYDFFKDNHDSRNPMYNTPNGIYHEGIGLDNVLFSWGHDEYLYQVCVQNGSTLPSQGLFMIRYHSCYAIHQKGAYQHLMTEEDKSNVQWLKKFQSFDLYSKLPDKPDVDKLMPYYKGLMDKYFPQELRW
jgi:inositol oxygenase